MIFLYCFTASRYLFCLKNVVPRSLHTFACSIFSSWSISQDSFAFSKLRNSTSYSKDAPGGTFRSGLPADPKAYWKPISILILNSLIQGLNMKVIFKKDILYKWCYEDVTNQVLSIRNTSIEFLAFTSEYIHNIQVTYLWCQFDCRLFTLFKSF